MRLIDLIAMFWQLLGTLVYSLVLNKRSPPGLLIFGRFSHPRTLFGPPLINLEKFLFQQLQIIQTYTVNKGYFD